MKAKKLNRTIDLNGKNFELYSLEGFDFNESIEIDDLSDTDKGVYYFGRIRGDKCHRLYLGKTVNLNRRPLGKTHGKWEELKQGGCNCIGIYKCQEGEDPKSIESDILSSYNFEYNIQENS